MSTSIVPVAMDNLSSMTQVTRGLASSMKEATLVWMASVRLDERTLCSLVLVTIRLHKSSANCVYEFILFFEEGGDYSFLDE